MQRLSNDTDFPIAFPMFDVDGLKLVNDTLGHDHGRVNVFGLPGHQIRGLPFLLPIFDNNSFQFLFATVIIKL
jgi:Response regulator containing a CheY-like receiver domain and a GGDEF domain